MYHEIKSRDVGNFLFLTPNFVGSTIIDWYFKEGTWIPSCYQCPHGRFDKEWLRSESWPQELKLKIPANNGEHVISSRCEGAIHVMPLYEDPYAHVCDAHVCALKDEDNVKLITNYVPVLFSPIDILFYDGDEISTTSFRLPYKDEAINIAEILVPTAKHKTVSFNNLLKLALSRETTDVKLIYVTKGFPYFDKDKFKFLLIEG